MTDILTLIAIAEPKTGSGRFKRFTSNVWVRVSVFVIAFAWTVPTAGILISSFRDPNAIRSSGW